MSRFQNLELLESAPREPAPLPTRCELRSLLQEASKAELEGSFEPALQKFSAALREDPTAEQGWAGQVRCLIRLEEFAEALVWAEKSAKVLPSSPLTHSAWAYALALSGEAEKALEISDRAFSLVVGDPPPHLWLERATCLMLQGRWSSAQACLHKVGELRSDSDWQQRQAEELLVVGKWEAAVSLLNEVVAARADRAYCWLLLAQGYREMGDSARHTAALNRADQLRPFWDLVNRERSRGLPFPIWIRKFMSWMRGKSHG